MNIPFKFSDPISHDILEDPVLAEDNYIYSRHTISKWFDQNKIGLPLSPLTGLPIARKLEPSIEIRNEIAAWKKIYGENLICVTHGFILNKYCEDCRSVTCPKCFDIQHQNHQCNAIPLYVPENLRILESSLLHFRQRCSAIKISLKDMMISVKFVKCQRIYIN